MHSSTGWTAVWTAVDLGEDDYQKAGIVTVAEKVRARIDLEPEGRKREKRARKGASRLWRTSGSFTPGGSWCRVASCAAPHGPCRRPQCKHVVLDEKEFVLAEGTVKWFSNEKGYGFIEREDGDDLFVHYSEINMDGYKTLIQGQRVEFEITEGDKGLQASAVRPLG